VYGDSHAFFIEKLDKSAVAKACDKTAVIVCAGLSKIFSTENESTKSVNEQIHHLIMLASPWPGFIKKPSTISHLEDYALAGDGMIFDAHALFEAYLMDNKHETRNLQELVQLYYYYE
jgi:hypothetical protein